MSVAGKRVLITGASRGLGRAAAAAFLRAGAQVVGTGRDRRAMAETEAALQAIGGTLRMVPLEVTDEAAVTEHIRSMDRLDVLVNNAAIADIKPFLETTTDEFRRVLDVNLTGAFIVMREAVRKMVSQGGGDIINIASTGAVQGIATMAPYATSKHGLLGLARSVGLEHRQHGVRVATVCPGPVKTEIMGPEWFNEDAIEPEELAQTLVHIVSIGPSMAIQELLIVPTRFDTHS